MTKHGTPAATPCDTIDRGASLDVLDNLTINIPCLGQGESSLLILPHSRSIGPRVGISGRLGLWGLLGVAAIACQGEAGPKCALPAAGSEGADSGSGSGSGGGYHLLPSAPCDAPRTGGDPAFTPLDDDAGLRAQDTLVYAGQSLSVADLDGDGARDLLLLHGDGPMLLMGSPGALAFREETAARLGAPPVAPRIASLLDLDEDGDVDILALDQEGAPSLFVNDGVGYFSLGALVGWPSLATKARSVAWVDVDGDGDLDAYQANDGTDGHDPRDLLLLRTGAFSFEDASERLPEAALLAYTKVASFIDVDHDQDPDLYIVNHIAPVHGGNTLYLNDGGGRFTAAPLAGLDVVMSGMGVSWADLNDDGLPDALISDWGDPRLFESAGDGSWYEAGRAMALDRSPEDAQVAGWGNALEDLDNDGDVDAMMVFGQGSEEEAAAASNPAGQPDAVWLDRGDRFEAAGVALGLDDPSEGRALGVLDLDGDGALDLVTSPRGAPARVWHGACDDRAWITVSVEGPPGNSTGAGARVQVEAGGRVQTRWLLAGGTSLETSLPVEAHFGLGDAAQIDLLRVELPGSPAVELHDLPVRARLVVELP
jgi:hypothetical protein